MRAFIVYSTFAQPKRIHATDDAAAIQHYVRAYFLNGGGPVESPRFRVYEAGEETSTIH